ncbi:hypothetical protein BJ322DRAFT_80802 [Thelephora terrestris]|uniref:Uncharacterized protein n=1 Tax=Thelephora terrestris TaxID=56493 RepID=A0A9P6HS82_9AGAM|nr:hypothetical protein BJ322DRAFT_80802 [Thelephora terrestris]
MAATLNEDILTLIFSHTFDFNVLRTTAAAIGIKNQHPLHRVVLRRFLQLPLCLSSENLEDSEALINHFVHNAEHANLVRDIVIVLGPSRKYIAEHRELRNAHLPEDSKQPERAEALVKLLPELLKHTKNLQYLDWSKSPPPNRETFEELTEHSSITHLSLDCSEQSLGFPDPGESRAGANIEILFSTIGPKVPSLDLRNVDEEIFKLIEQGFPPLKNVRNLKLDLTCGVSSRLKSRSRV